MPWHMERRGDKVVIVKDSDGKVVGSHSDRKKALAQLRALYASESIRKDRFATRSEAGRYAANIRWQRYRGNGSPVKLPTNTPDVFFPNWRTWFHDVADANYPGGYGWDDPTVSFEQSKAQGELRSNLKADVMRRLAESLESMSDEDIKFCMDYLTPPRKFEIETLSDRQVLAKQFVDAWAQTSNSSPYSQAVQTLVAEIFGLEVIDEYRDDDEYFSERRLNLQDTPVRKMLTRLIERTYSDTQDMLRQAGIKEVTLYRGLGTLPDTSLPKDSDDNLINRSDFDYLFDYFESNSLGDVDTIKQVIDEQRELLRSREFTEDIVTRPLSSWSGHVGTANDFALGSSNLSRRMEVTIPAERVFATPFTGIGCFNEYEFVILGGVSSAKITHLTSSNKFPRGTAPRSFFSLGAVEERMRERLRELSENKYVNR